MIRPCKKKPVKRTYAAYDLEWFPETLELRLIGIYDGSSYKCYTRVSDFLSEWLSPTNSGMWFYAHAGGLYDFQFLLDTLKNSGYRIEATFSGSSAVVVKVTDGEHEWFFLDSYWLLRSPLASIGEWLGRPKGDCAFDAPLPELIAYNEQDCRILYHAIEFFENLIWELGGQLERTIASTALSLFKRKYLKREIFTQDYINTRARFSYVASRVEVFQRKCQQALYYDINSSFPYAMLDPLPANLLATEKRLPRTNLKFLADITIKVPESNIPPLPYRDKHNRVFFPFGEWRGWFSDTDVNLAVETGCDIVKVHRCHIFDEFTDLAEYVTEIYALRLRSISEAEKYVLKILLNSLYGKFGERGLKEKMLINATREELKRYHKDCRRFVAPGIYLVEKLQTVPHEWVPIAADTTAKARRNLYNHLTKCAEIYYCDTDGFACDRDTKHNTSSQLGGLKLEKILDEGCFAAPKLYALKEEGKDWKVKAKGFSKVKHQGHEKSTGIKYEHFLELLEHREIEIETFSRIRSSIKNPDLLPVRGTKDKTWRGKIRPKRADNGNGGTRPWHVDEIQNTYQSMR